MKIKSNIDKLKEHLRINSTDFKGWLRLFDLYDAFFLEEAQQKHPNSIIRSPNSDLIASGVMPGLGGSVPRNWDGSIYDWNGKLIKGK